MKYEFIHESQVESCQRISNHYLKTESLYLRTAQRIVCQQVKEQLK